MANDGSIREALKYNMRNADLLGTPLGTLRALQRGEQESAELGSLVATLEEVEGNTGKCCSLLFDQIQPICKTPKPTLEVRWLASPGPRYSQGMSVQYA